MNPIHCVGGLLMLGGRMGDLLGRRRMFLAGTALFAVASLACGLATTPGFLIAARVVHGVSAALMAPTALSILVTTFDDEGERNAALAAWGAVGGVGATVALLVGGVLTDAAGWRSIFFINLPVAAAVPALAPVLLRESRAGAGGVRHRRSGDADARPAGAHLRPRRGAGRRVGRGEHARAAGRRRGGRGGVRRDRAPVARAAHPARLVPPPRARGRERRDAAGRRVRVGRRAWARWPPPGPCCSGWARCSWRARSRDGSYLVDLFPGFVVFGPGLGVATVAGSIAALGGVAEEHAGVASGTTTAAFQIGGALGGAIATTVVVERGLGAAFATSAVVAGLALAAALVPLRPRALRAPGPQRA